MEEVKELQKKIKAKEETRKKKEKEAKEKAEVCWIIFNFVVSFLFDDSIVFSISYMFH